MLLLRDALPDAIAAIGRVGVRMPVRNVEERVAFLPIKRAIIYQRDGGCCRYCGTQAKDLVLDHIEPRSFFMPSELHIADRSDNLASACWSCNEAKGNRDWPRTRVVGVTARCWDCQQHEYLEERPWCPVPAFCGRCHQTTTVPDFSWLL